MELLLIALYTIFVCAAIVLAIVVLLQEGKGGGLTNALGSSGQQTFGVGATGINKFTGWVGGVFLVSAMSIHFANRVDANSSVAPFMGHSSSSDANGGSPTTSEPLAPTSK